MPDLNVCNQFMVRAGAGRRRRKRDGYVLGNGNLAMLFFFPFLQEEETQSPLHPSLSI